MATSSKGNGFIFKVKSEDGLALRVLSEYFANLLTFPPFQVNDKGIFVRAVNKQGEVLVDAQMPRSSFPIFKCAKPIYFGVNATHFYRLLRPIKKKDTVSLFIREQLPMQLGICVEQGDKPGDRVTTYIQINYIQPDEIELPEGYDDNPIIETSKRFQRLKMLHTIGPNIWATVIGGKRIRFTVNGKNLFSREVTIGETSDDDNDDENTPSYTLTYPTNHITQLTKCAGQSGNVQIFQNEELPLFIQMRLGSLATLSIYIKSKELIEQLESSAENTNKENQPSDQDKSEEIEIMTNIPKQTSKLSAPAKSEKKTKPRRKKEKEPSDDENEEETESDPKNEKDDETEENNDDEEHNEKDEDDE